MKRLTISKLMDEYQDNEVFPQGGSAADVEAVKNRVLAGAKTPAKQRGRIPTRKKVLLAGALAAIMVVLVGAGLPYIQHQLANGTLSYEQTGDGRITALVHYGPVMYLENGRIFFTQDDGQSVDITDLISEETPYIYDGSDPSSGMMYYIIMGGTPDRFGHLEWIETPDPFDDDSPYDHDRKMSVAYAFMVSDAENHQRNIGTARANIMLLEDEMRLPWLMAGIDELGIPYTDPSEANANYVLEKDSYILQ